MLAFYCFVFVVPLMALVLIRIVLPTKSVAIFESVTRLTKVWGKRIIIAALAIVGALFVIDGTGWFLGMPLFKF